MKVYLLYRIFMTVRRGWAIGGLAVLVAGCVSNPGDTQNLRQRGMDPVIIRSKAESDANRAMGRSTMKIHNIHNTGYVSLSDVASATGYHGAWLKDGVTYGMGDTDVVWSFSIGKSRVNKAGQEVRMPAQAVRENGAMMIPADGLPELIGREAVLSAGAFGISVLPRPTVGETGSDGTSLPFSSGRAGMLSAKGVGNDGSAVTGYAKRFAGAPFEFGAGPYASGGTFDSSSYVKHVMKRFGVDLPRSVRQMAAMGSPVSRDELLPGDLLFFNVLGRYKSQAAPGHVGIYIGDGRMIHASPSPSNGVQITALNNPDDLRSFLYAKRVLTGQ